MKIGSRWSYLMVGVNIMIALFGALLHNLILTIMGSVFAFWNWQTAEFNRSLEDESIREESRSNTDTETKE